MKIHRIKIKNMGPFNDVDLRLDGKSIAFVGTNGTGKTLLLSSLVDCIYEYFTAIGFRDVTPSGDGLNHTYFRIASPKFLAAGTNKGYIWITGALGDEEISYLEQYGYSQNDLARELGIESSKIPWDKNQAKNILKVGDDKKKELREKMLSESIFFLPASRFENESWRTEAFFSEDFSPGTHYSSELGRKIELSASLKENYIWLTNEVLDHYVTNGSDIRCELRINLVAKFLGKIMSSNSPLRINVSTNHYDRLSIIDENQRIIVKSFEDLSMGQLVALNLLLDILRIGNNLKAPADYEGLVMVDEIDAHTTGHITSQVIPEIMETFPKIQFIVTTHDPVSVVGIENYTNVKVVELPSGKEILAKDYRELEETRKRLKVANDEVRRINSEIEKINKPVLVVEDQCKKIYKAAWLKLHDTAFTEADLDVRFDTEAPFEIISAGGHNNLRAFLDQAPISGDVYSKRIVGLFDFDEAYNSFLGLSKNLWGPVNGTDRKGLSRRRLKSANFSALVLPVPYARRGIASKGFGGQSRLEVELYFPNRVLGQAHVGIDPGRPGNIVKFLGNKAIFWREAIGYGKKDFSAFRALFKKVYELLDL